MSRPIIAIVDAGLGNLASVARAFERAALHARLDVEVQLVDAPAGVRAASRVVVPGQGAFGEAAAALRPDAPLGGAVIEAVRAGRPYLGICLGHQVLFDSSEESPGHPGFGLFRGAVRKLPTDLVDSDGTRRLKVPHVGWARVALRGSHPVLDTMADPWFYFVHSYHAVPADPALVSAVAAFGEVPVTAAVARDNLVGVQFHPEKSQRAGLELLANFLQWKP